MGYLVELFGWGGLTFDLHKHWGEVGKGWVAALVEMKMDRILNYFRLRILLREARAGAE